MLNPKFEKIELNTKKREILLPNPKISFMKCTLKETINSDLITFVLNSILSRGIYVLE